MTRALEWRFDATTPPLRGNFESSDGTVLREAVIAGLGLVSIPYFMVAPDVVAGRLELVLEKHERAPLSLFALVAGGRGQPLRLRALVDHFAAAFAARDWRLAPFRTKPAPAPARRVSRRARA